MCVCVHVRVLIRSKLELKVGIWLCNLMSCTNYIVLFAFVGVLIHIKEVALFKGHSTVLSAGAVRERERASLKVHLFAFPCLKNQQIETSLALNSVLNTLRTGRCHLNCLNACSRGF